MASTIRIISGSLKGRRFSGPVGHTTRPTSDRVREGLASALETRRGFGGAEVLDLFAGTGALSFEALSRGALNALLVDKHREAVKAIEATKNALGLQNRVKVLCLDLFADPPSVVRRIAYAHPKPFDLIFADPPYSEIDRLAPLLNELSIRKWFTPNALLSIEHSRKLSIDGINQLGAVDNYRYGDTVIAIVHYGVQGDSKP